jgi:hypothetical protein
VRFSTALRAVLDAPARVKTALRAVLDALARVKTALRAVMDALARVKTDGCPAECNPPVRFAYGWGTRR